MNESPPVSGLCDPLFAPVQEALERNFADHNELGAAVAITLGGETVVDVWAGWMDERRTRPWQRDTLVDVFSVGKPIAALCVLMLAERGELDLDAPVADYWPAFSSEATVEMVLSHRAGVPGISRPLPDDAIYDQDVMAAAIAEEQPWWTPGARHGYHVNTFGFLVAELVRRVSGRTIGEFVRDQIATPLGADLQFGIGPDDDRRTAEYVLGSETEVLIPDDADQELKSMIERVYFNPPGISGLGTVNTRAWRAAQMPSTNAHATARAVTSIYKALLDGRLVSSAMLERATAEVADGPDAVLGRPSRFGLGFQLTQPERPLGPNPRSFGHFGAGGALAFADPDAGLVLSYAMNRSGPRWQNPRNRELIDAAYLSLRT